MAEWSEAQVAELKRRWDAGETCSEIGAAMGFSRNAVIGKVHRLGLDGRKKSKSALEIELAKRRAAERNAANKRSARRLSREKEMQEAIAVQQEVYEPLNIAFSDLRDFSSFEQNQCRYIADEPPARDYRACGLDTLPGESYCAHCKPITLNKTKLTQTERANVIHLGRRNYLRSLRRAAA